MVSVDFFCPEGTPSLVWGSRQATEGAKMGAGSSMVMAFVLHKVGMVGMTIPSVSAL